MHPKFDEMDVESLHADAIGIGKEHNSPAAKPSNYTFVVENIVSGTSLASNSCQFVQSQDLSLSLKEEPWKPELNSKAKIVTESRGSAG
jgi:hypothetical protein